MSRHWKNPFNVENHAAFLFIAIFVTVISLSRIENAWANVPSVTQIENLSQGTAGKIRLQINHLNPSGSHYIDQVEVDVGGQVKSFGLQPQNSNPFTVELELGQLQGTPDAKARVHCIVHGWSSWSNEIQVPELSNMAVTALAALTVALLITRRHTPRTRKHSQSLVVM